MNNEIPNNNSLNPAQDNSVTSNPVPSMEPVVNPGPVVESPGLGIPPVSPQPVESLSSTPTAPVESLDSLAPAEVPPVAPASVQTPIIEPVVNNVPTEPPMSTPETNTPAPAGPDASAQTSEQLTPPPVEAPQQAGGIPGLDQIAVAQKAQEASKKKSNLPLIIVTIIVILAIAGGVYYFFFLNKTPDKVLQSKVDVVMDKMFALTKGNSDKYSVKYNTKLNITTGSEDIIPSKIMDFIKKLSLSYEVQIDKTQKEMYFGIIGNHNSEKIFDIKALVDSNELLYIDLGDFYRRPIYGKISGTQYEEITNILSYDYNTIESVIKEEVKKLITKDNTKKEGNFIVLDLSDNDSNKAKFKTLFDNLRNNEKFLKAFADSKSIKESLDQAYKAIDEDKEQNTFIIKVSEKEFNIQSDDTIVSGTYDNTTINAKATNTHEDYEGNKVTDEIDIKIITKGTEKDGSTDVTFIVKDTSVNFVVDYKYSSIDSIGGIDKTKAVNEENLSEYDMQEIQNNIMNSKLSEVIESLMDEFMPSNPEPPVYYYDDTDNDLDYDWDF